MSFLWHDYPAFHIPTEGYRIAGWGTLATANELIRACNASCRDTIMLDVSDAAFVAKWREK